ENHEVALFTYVAVLDAGMLALTVFRPWQRLIFGAFAATFLLYIGWYSSYYSDDQLTPTLVFAALFFALFSAAPLVASRAAEIPASVQKAVVMLPLLNAAGFFLQLYAMLHLQHYAALAWCALGLAAVYIGISRAAP